jgi:type IX secretion system PorP/SprF family membrane protein
MLSYRSQWVGIDGAPVTQTLTFHSPAWNRVGLGVSVLRDAIGPSTETYFAGDFSYAIPFGDGRTQLAFGLKAGYFNLNLNINDINILNPGDAGFANTEKSGNAIIGTGLYLYNDQGYIGVSTPNLVTTSHYDGIANTTIQEKMHLYLMGGYVFPLNPNLQFKPAFLVKAVNGAPLGVDVSANFLINESFTLGASYRLDSAISILAGFQVNNAIFIGYGYDFDTTDLAQYNSGSHEVLLRIDFMRRVRRNMSPRFF